MGASELGDFLRARRHTTAAASVDYAAPLGRRRTPGLRREEVAYRAGISIDYYIRLEQGRESNPSRQVLQALGTAFALPPQAMAHLFTLAGLQPPRNPTENAAAISPHLLRMMHSWNRTPAYITTPWSDVVASNALAGELFAQFAPTSNYARMILLDPAAREFFVDWESTARLVASALQNVVATDPDNPRGSALIGELSIKSPEFRRWWALREVAEPAMATKDLLHSTVGPLTVSYETLTINSAPGQLLVVYHAEPDSPTERAFDRLHSSTLATTASPTVSTVDMKWIHELDL
ncbi:DNA-binding protein [Rhodococcus sp. B7740]|uniref:helix-turn-helix transcriptional regulator n=1 Tax=Rhodococcus sp. B7740 TaxID=1564114 RepID=UPI0005D83380|nr:helix-turn-helix transcriptional regulator [Rhodococcus sp. B7740]AJW40209.1 DNA-binding protein [Rhodococcus sp. B7740]